MSTQGPLRKRRRDDVENPSIPTAVSFLRHEDLWFEGGHVVLVAADNVAFRVPCETSSRHSGVFRDIFTLPVPSENAADTFDGCPVIRVHDHSADLSHFLHVLCDAGNSTLFNHKTSKFSLIAACLRLSHKYEVEYILQKALARLEECFPATFSAWDNDLHRNNTWVPIELANHDAICVVNLARSLHLPSVLPSALYACTQLPTRFLLRGVRCSDGTFQRLCPADIEACWDGQKELSQRKAKTTACLDDATPSSICEYKKECTAAMRRLTHKYRKCSLGGYDVLRPIMTQWLAFENKRLAVPMCGWCIAHLGHLERKAQGVVWDELEKIFALVRPV